MVNGKAFGAAVKALREAAGWSQAELAARSGVPKGTLGPWEVGHLIGVPKHQNLPQLLAVLGVSSVPELVMRADMVQKAASGDLGALIDRKLDERLANLEHMPIGDAMGGPRIPLVAFTSAGLGGGGPVTGYEYVAPEQMYGAQLRAARVVGECMAPEVEEGDIVIFDASRREPRNGQLIVATLLDTDEAVLKRFYREGQMVRLQPNRGEPITVQGERLLIEGIVIEVRRRYNGPA